MLPRAKGMARLGSNLQDRRVAEDVCDRAVLKLRYDHEVCYSCSARYDPSFDTKIPLLPRISLDESLRLGGVLMPLTALPSLPVEQMWKLLGLWLSSLGKDSSLSVLLC